MRVEAGKYYRLRVPSWVDTLGQGDPPQAWESAHDGSSVRVAWGAVVRASETVGLPGDDTASPPLVHTTALRPLARRDQLEQVEN